VLIIARKKARGDEKEMSEKKTRSKKERRQLGRDERPKPLTKKERKERRVKRRLKKEEES